MQSIVCYQLSSSDESSSDESQDPELLQLQPRKKFCSQPEIPSLREPERQTSVSIHPHAGESHLQEQAIGQQEHEDDEEEQEEEQEEEKEQEIQPEKQQQDEFQRNEIQAHSNNNPTSKVRKKSYALDYKELPVEMQNFLLEVKRFFTREFNLERQAKALAASTYQKAQERILCELFRKFTDNSLNALIFVVFICVHT